MQSRFSLPLAGIAVLCLLQTSHAVLINFSFSGTLTGPGSALNNSFGTLAVGTPYTGTFVYDNAAPATPLGGLGFSYPGVSLSVTFGSETATATSVSITHYSRDLGYPTDLLLAYGQSVSGTLGGLPVTGLSLALQRLGATVLPVGSLPGPDLNFSQFTPGNATFIELMSSNSAANTYSRGELGSGSVPEPSALGLLALTLPMTARRRR